VLSEVVWWTKTKGRGAPIASLLLPVGQPEYVSAYTKPRIGGLWTSPEGSEYGWENWCRENEMDWLGDRYVLAVSGEPRTLIIDSAAALERAWKNYGRQRDWGDRDQYTDRDLNYELIAQDFDALWLTEAGFAETRMALGLNTYAWDCETMLWFRWCFSSVRLDTAEVSA
jgi:hypothetical protein